MTLLIISPDYASHLLPLATIGTAWRDAGERVVVATGPATASIVESFGFDRIELQLGRGSNPGVIRAEDQPDEEDDSLRGFFAATREGMVETLAYQARERLTDLMWEPVRVAREVQRVVAAIAPDAIIVDHLAFSARLALDAAGLSYADVVLGHPSALPLPGEVYGFPPQWPEAFTPDPAALARLRALCERVSESFTAEWNAALAELAPVAEPVADAFQGHGDLLLFNYPEQLHDRERTARLPAHVFLGSAVRDEPEDPAVTEWLAAGDDPFVYVSFGSFLSVRGDVLGKVAAALRFLGLRAAIAVGSTPPEQLGVVPGDWLVREYLPQVTLLTRAAAAVTHGGNNSVTEAMTFGVPLLVLPFSTDQFAGAASVEWRGAGLVLAPNVASVDELVNALRVILAAGPLTELSETLRQEPGSARAFASMTSSRIASGSEAASR